ncbi:MAG TPA: tRNA preQ1(34) S-adenosylmethionine ribosyltransferase-isomerase QueA [Vicinamibacterales bacterium]|nr:tRNA preQ1(34) S-adenosylmethionine ribosyltransferase-isomerase QueA [Vicinamibacterales bacterium]
MLVSDFSFDLPDSQIAQAPAPRGQARLLIVRRSTQSWEVATTGQLARFLDPGDLVVANDTRVIPARLLGRRDPSGGAVECLLLRPEPDGTWQALVHPGQKLKPGARVVFDDAARAPGVRVRAEILDRRYFGRRLLRFDVEGAASLDAAVDAIGHVPLPPYIHRLDTADDRDRYQTVFARTRGSVAAPTAGLHFDEAALSGLSAAGINWATITLHVGYGTFKPVRVSRVEDHQVDAERFLISETTADAIAAARAAGRRVVAVGTTTVRALESVAARNGRVEAGTGETSLFIHPGHRFQVVDALFTNFHLPQSSLLMLVAAFAGTDLTLAAYRHAVAAGFRFYSYGDAMLIL